MLWVEKDFINKAFGKIDSFSIKQRVYSVGDKLNTEVIKREMLTINTFINQISKNLDIDKLREQIPSGEEDEMFSFDREYKNPWIVVFLYVVRCCRGFNVSQEVQDKIRILTENKLIPIFDYANFKGLEADKMSTEELMQQLNLTIIDKSMEIAENVLEDLVK